MTDSLEKLLSYVNSICGTHYNGILINKYNSGEDYISSLCADEINLDDAGVVSISWDATRKFRIRNKINKKIVGDFPLISGTMLQMKGEFQKEFTHEIPVEKKVKTQRISFTFRKHFQ